MKTTEDSDVQMQETKSKTGLFEQECTALSRYQLQHILSSFRGMLKTRLFSEYWYT